MLRNNANCPNCNSLEPFAPKFRIVDRGKIWEQYAKCGVCDHEVILARYTEDEYKELQKRIKRAAHRRRASKKAGRRAG